MSIHNGKNRPHKLPKRRSPKALDEKILAYSREQAPRRVRSTSTWMQIAAVASVCVVTVLIVLPEHSNRAPGTTTLSEQRADDRASAEFDRQVEQKMQATAPKRATPAAPNVHTAQSALLNQPAGLAPQIQEPSAQGFKEAEARQAMEESATPVLQKRLIAQDTADVMASSAEPIWSEALVKKLRAIKKQIDAGNRQQALTAYKALRREYPNAGLSENMDTALAKLPAQP